MSSCCLTKSDSADDRPQTAGQQPRKGGDQVDEQDEQVAHRHILPTSPPTQNLIRSPDYGLTSNSPPSASSEGWPVQWETDPPG